MPPALVEPVGALAEGDGRWRFVVWAPDASSVAVALHGGRRDGERHPLRPVPIHAAAGVGGYWTAVLDGLEHGDRYRLVLDDGPPLADPASRWQPHGVAGPSALVDPARLARHRGPFEPPELSRTVLYELHVGAFTTEGTFDAAIGQLDRLVDVGVTTVELMPVAEFPGTRNWGYDGVFPYAAQSSYGGPEGLARLVAACHTRGLAVLLDVVHNHLGPEGCVLPRFGPYTTDRYRTPWGPAMNVDGWGADEVRRYLIGSARWWLEALDLDGFRLDAIHGIVDPTARGYLGELTTAVADVARHSGRRRVVVAESADNDPRVLAPVADGGRGMDGQWNDDFHHALRAVLTGERRHVLVDYGSVGQLRRAVAGGFVFTGQHNRFRGRRHGAPAQGVAPWRFVVYDQNHDQVGNRPRGDRLTTQVPAERVDLAVVLVALSPGTPMLFMGEEYGETAPFPYVIDHADPALVEAVRRGRAAEMGDLFDAEPLDPADPAVARLAVLDPGQAAHGAHAERLALWRRLLGLRRSHPALAPGGTVDVGGHGDLVALHRAAGSAQVLVLVHVGTEPVAHALPAGVSWRLLDGSSGALQLDGAAGATAPGGTSAPGGATVPGGTTVPGGATVRVAAQGWAVLEAVDPGRAAPGTDPTDRTEAATDGGHGVATPPEAAP